MKQRMKQRMFAGGALVGGGILLLGLMTNLSVAGDPTDPLINEFVVDHVSVDTHEYIEISGDPDTNYSFFTLLEIEGDASSGTQRGRVDTAITVGTTNNDGYWTTGFQNNVFENQTISLLLVKNFVGVVGSDLDIDDDGILDVTPWTALVDAVGVNDGDAGDHNYANVTLTAGFDGQPAQPGGASRLPDSVDTDTVADWTRNDFDGAGLPGFVGTPAENEASNTPHTVNQLALVPSLAASLTAVPLTLPEPGGLVTFALHIQNTGPFTLTLSAMVDDAWGSLHGQGSCLLPQTVGINDQYACAYNGAVSGQMGEVITHTAVVTGTTTNSLIAVNSATASVTITTPVDPPDDMIYLPVVLSPDLYGEPNNSCNDAHPLVLNQPGSFLAEDTNDWYAFTLPVASHVQVVLANFVPAVGQITVWSGNCADAQLIGHDGSRNTDRVLDLGMQPAGPYYIWLINDGPTNMTDFYTLTVR